MSGISIVGSGHTRFGKLEDKDLEALIVDAAREAMQEAGVTGADIDAVFLGHFNSGMASEGFASSLVHQADDGLRFKPAARCENACASGSAAVFAGMDAIRAGRAERVLVVGVEKMTHRSTPDVTAALAGAGYQGSEDEAGLSFPQVFAHAAQLYAQRHGDPMQAMAQIASKNHANAMHNPLAQMQRPLSVAQCHEVSDKNPVIAPPLRLSDCSLISDGAAAVVLTRADAASDFAHKALIEGAAHVSEFLPMSRRDFLRFEGPKRAVAEAYAASGRGAADMNFAEVHDCFTIAELLMYEALQLCGEGEGRGLLDAGTVMPGGATPVNLSGGLKAKGHPVGATGVSMHALAYRQVTGQAGDMQAKGAERGIIVNMGGAGVANYASVIAAQG